MSPARVGGVAGLAVALVAFPLVATEALTRTGALTAIAVVGALGMNVITGVARQFSVGHAGLIAVGAYTTAIGMDELGLPAPLALLLGPAVAALFGLLLAPLAFKLRHLGLALVTFGFVFVVQHVLRNVSALSGGIRPRAVPEVQLLGIDFGSPSRFGAIELSRNDHYYFLGLVLAVLSYWAVRNLLDSRVGRNLRMMGDYESEVIASHVGVRLRWTKTQAFVVSSFLAGLAGALLAPYTRVLQWQAFDLSMSVEYLAMIIIGGVGTASGSVLGAVFAISLRDVIRLLAPVLPFVADAGATDGLTIAQATTLAHGAMIVVILAVWPGGLLALITAARARLRRGSGPPPSAAAGTVPDRAPAASATGGR